MIPIIFLLRQAYQEVFDQQMEEVRLRNAFATAFKAAHIVIIVSDTFTAIIFSYYM
jgi:hypothetical protein